MRVSPARGVGDVAAGVVVPVRARCPYMAIIADTRWYPVIRSAYRHPREAGKPAKVALIARMRRLLVIFYALLATRRPWRQPAIA